MPTLPSVQSAHPRHDDGFEDISNRDWNQDDSHPHMHVKVVYKTGDSFQCVCVNIDGGGSERLRASYAMSRRSSRSCARSRRMTRRRSRCCERRWRRVGESSAGTSVAWPLTHTLQSRPHALADREPPSVHASSSGPGYRTRQCVEAPVIHPAHWYLDGLAPP